MLPLDIGEIDRLLAEDIAAGDLTTESLGIGALPGTITFQARRPMTVAGIEIAAQMMQRNGVIVELRASTSQKAAAGEILLAGKGTAEALHATWKVAQTLVEILSGIATATSAIVDTVKAANPAVRVACTRKTFPGGRRLCHLAVRAGGAVLHRAGLSETILIFPEHLAFLPEEPLRQMVTRLRETAPEKKLTIEVNSVEEAREAIDVGFDVIQLEKFVPAQVAEVAGITRNTANPPLLAIAGGVTAANAAAYVEAGAGLIVTSWPYNAGPADVQVTITNSI